MTGARSGGPRVAGVPQVGEPVLKLTDVSKTYPGTPSVEALRHVDLAIRPGEYVAVVGASGSGKSTLLSIAGTLEQPSAGTVHLLGEEVTRLSDRMLAALRATAIGFVFQQYFLMEALSVADNVVQALIYCGVPHHRRRTEALAALEQVGLSHKVHEKPNHLSGGERQRVAIARAIVTHPSLLLCDEPTGNLDSVTGEHIMTLIGHLNQGGTTVLVVTHDRDIAHRLPRRVEMRDGRILQDVRRTPEGG